MKSVKRIIFFLLIIILLILSFKYFFTNKPNLENERVESENLKKIKQESGEKISVNISEYNQKMHESIPFKYLVKIMNKNNNTYELTSEQMMSFAVSYAFIEQEEILRKNSKEIIEEEPIYVKYEYLNSLTKEIFDKELNKNELKDYLKDEYLYISLPTSYPKDLYKFNELRYDSNNNIYSMFFDKIDLDAKDYEIIENYGTINFDYNTITKNYRILYKKIDNKNVIIGIEQII